MKKLLLCLLCAVLLTGSALAELSVTVIPWEGMVTAMPQLTEDVRDYYGFTMTQQELEDKVRSAGFLLSRGPSGETGLMVVDYTLMTVNPEGTRIVMPSADRGVEDQYGKLKKRLTQFLYAADQAAWSPDGRYAMLTDTLAFTRSSYLDPVLIDTMTGEAILLMTAYPKGGGIASGVTAACFSRDGRYLYYVLYGREYDTRSTLMRCDLSTMEVTCCTGLRYGTPETASLAELENGSLITTGQFGNRRTALSLQEYTEDGWQDLTLSFGYSWDSWLPNRICMAPGSDAAVVIGTLQPGRSGTLISCMAVLRELTEPQTAEYWVIMPDDTLRQLTEKQIAACGASAYQWEDGLDQRRVFFCDMPPAGNELMVCYINADQMPRMGLIDLRTMTMRQMEDLPEECASLLQRGGVKKLEWYSESTLLLMVNNQSLLLQLNR